MLGNVNMATKQEQIEAIARAAHEVNRAWCLAHGDTSQPHWEDAPEWQKTSAKNGVSFHLGRKDSTPEDSHNNWLREKIGDGWRYGEVKDPVAKTHPCLCTYEALPPEQRVKDSLFIAVVRAMEAGFEQ
jgi:hypothetical protein